MKSKVAVKTMSIWEGGLDIVLFLQKSLCLLSLVNLRQTASRKSNCPESSVMQPRFLRKSSQSINKIGFYDDNEDVYSEPSVGLCKMLFNKYVAGLVIISPSYNVHY